MEKTWPKVYLRILMNLESRYEVTSLHCLGNSTSKTVLHPLFYLQMCLKLGFKYSIFQYLGSDIL